MLYLFVGGFNLNDAIELTRKIDKINMLLLDKLKVMIPRLFSVLLSMGILRYILFTRGFNDMVLIGMVWIVFAIKGSDKNGKTKRS